MLHQFSSQLHSQLQIMDRHRPPQLDALVQHSDWIRRLARELVPGKDQADDVVQQTFLQALEAPPRHDRNLRGWLGVVARNVIRRMRIVDAQRSRREALSTAEEQPPSTSYLVERIETLRQVSGAVLSVREPYRTVLLLRYYEDLSPREIATRLRVPLETIRSQIKRGLSQVREHLDRAHAGDRGKWLPGLLLWSGVTPGTMIASHSTGQLVGGLLIMSKSAKIIGVAVLLIAAAFVGSQMVERKNVDQDGPAPRVAVSPVESNPPRIPAREARSTGAAGAANDRQELPSPAPVVSLTVRVLSSRAQEPLVEAAVKLALSLSKKCKDIDDEYFLPQKLVATTTGADGRAVFTVRPDDVQPAPDEPRQRVVAKVLASAPHHVRGDTQFEWPVADWSVTEGERTIVLEPASVLAGRVIAADTKEPVIGASLRLGYGEPYDGKPHAWGWTMEDGEFCARYDGERQLLVSARGFLERGVKIDSALVAASQPMQIALERDTLTHALEAIVLDPRGEPDRTASELRFTSESVRHETPPSQAVFSSSPELVLRAFHGNDFASDLLLADGKPHRAMSVGSPPGVFHLRSLDAGTYRVEVALRGGNALDLGRVEIPPDGDRLVLKQVAPTGIAGVLHGDGDLMLWLEVYDHLDGPRPLHRSQTLAGKDGRFRFVGLPAREPLRLAVARAGTEQLLIDRFTLEPAEMREGLELTLSAIDEPRAITVTGVVSDVLSREPLAGARVSRPVSAMGQDHGRGPEPDGAVTDARGGFRLANIPPHEALVLVQKEGYYDLNKRLPPVSDTVELKVLPRDEERLMASGLFTRVQVNLDVDGGAIPEDCALQLLVPAAEDGWRTSDLPGNSAEALAGTERGFEGIVPSPASVSAANGEHPWTLPERLRAEVFSSSTGLTGMGESLVRAGGVTRLDVRLAQSEVRLTLRDARSGEPLSAQGLLVKLLKGSRTIEMASDGAGATARAVPAGRYEISVRLESGKGIWYRAWPAAIDVTDGTRAWEVQVLRRRGIRVHVFAADGSELRPLRPQPGQPPPDDPNAVTLLVDSIQVMGEAVPLANLNRIQPPPGPSGEIAPSYYVAWLPIDESSTVAVESAGRRSEPQTVLVTRDTTELSFRLTAP